MPEDKDLSFNLLLIRQITVWQFEAEQKNNPSLRWQDYFKEQKEKTLKNKSLTKEEAELAFATE